MAEIIAGRGHRVVGDRDPGPALAGIRRVVETNQPECFVRRMAMHPHILTEIYQHVGNAVLKGQTDHAVHGIFLADAAEIQPHPAPGQKNTARPALNFVPAHQLARGLDRLVTRNDWRLRLPVPQFDQRQCRRVKRAAREEK